MELPTASDVRTRIQNCEESRRAKDSECFIKVRRMIIERMERDPQSTMRFIVAYTDFSDMSQCKLVMNRLRTDLDEKGFQTEWEYRYSTSLSDAEYWSGANLSIRVP